jgi:Ca-activated chloride channel family protein
MKTAMHTLKILAGRLTTIAAIATVVIGQSLSPALACQEEAMLVFDASGSMQLPRGGLPKIDIAREAAADVLPELTRRRPTGLVTYGGELQQGCKSVFMRFPPMTGSGDLINGELSALQPAGSTPLTEAVWTAALTLKNSGKPGTIVLITDGKENCGYNACTFGTQMALGAKNIKVNVIGFYLNANAETDVACLAKKPAAPTLP